MVTTGQSTIEIATEDLKLTMEVIHEWRNGDHSRIAWDMIVSSSLLLVASGQDFGTHVDTLEVGVADGGESGVEGQSPVSLDVDVEGNSRAVLDEACDRSGLTHVILPAVEDGGKGRKLRDACWP